MADASESHGSESKSLLGPGSVLAGLWHLEMVVGSGGMGLVYAGTGVDGQRVAIKVLHPQTAKRPEMRERLVREALCGRRVHHHSMVSVLGDGTQAGHHPFLVMELLEGRTLDSLWRTAGGRLPIPFVLATAASVLDLLAVCHDMGILHRDLKPSNIFVLPDDGVKVLDFGIAHLPDMPDQLARRGTALGTPSFIAPEQAMGAWDAVDVGADIFGVGAIIFALTSGQRLHQGRSESESFTLAATSKAPSLAEIDPELPPGLIELVDRALCWDKRARFATTREMLTAVTLLLENLDPECTSRTVDLDSTRAEPDDPFVVQLREVFEGLSVLVGDVKARRISYDDFEVRLTGIREQLEQALSSHDDPTELVILPYGVRVGSHMVWEPDSGASVLYDLFSTGIRKLFVGPTVTWEDIRALLDILREMPHDDDAVTMLWRAQAPNVRVEVEEGHDGDDPTSGLGIVDAERVAGAARDLDFEVREWMDEKVQAPGALTLVLVAPDRVAMLERDLAEEREADGRERYLRTLAAGCLESALDEDEQSPWTQRAGAELLLSRKPDLLLEAHARTRAILRIGLNSAQRSAVDARVSSILVSERHVDLLIRAIARLRVGSTPSSHADPTDHLLPQLTEFLHSLGTSGVAAALRGLRDVAERRLRSLLLDFIQELTPTNERLIASALTGLPVEIGWHLLRGLVEANTPRARHEVVLLADGPLPVLRLAARGYLCGPTEDLRQELFAFMEDSSPPVREAAIRTAMDLEVDEAVTRMATVIESPSFHQRHREDRAQMLELLHEVDAVLGEEVLIRLVQRHGVLTDESLTSTRILAVEMLGNVSTSEDAAAALKFAASPMWWNPPRLRRAAVQATQTLEGAKDEAEGQET